MTDPARVLNISVHAFVVVNNYNELSKGYICAIIII